MKIVLGTYEGNLISWESDFHADDTGRTLKLAYAFNAHPSSVRCLSFDGTSGCDKLVSGGADESIKLYDLKNHREIGSLLEHKDAVSCLKFHGAKHMLSAGRDGGICIWRTEDWLCLDTMRGHKGAVNYISIHPSGRLALSVGQDKTLHMWDLTKGKHAYKLKLPAEGHQVHWNADGSKYLVIYDADIIVYEGRTGKDLYKLPLERGRRICDSAIFTHKTAGTKKKPAEETEYIAAGLEGGDVIIWDLNNTRRVVLQTGHAKRARCVAYSQGAASGHGEVFAKTLAPFSSDALSPLSKLAAESKKVITLPECGAVLVTADSEGIVKIWDFPAILARTDDKPIEDMAALVTITAASGSRATSMCVSMQIGSAAELADMSTPAAATAKAAAPSKKLTPATAAVSGQKRKAERGTSHAGAGGKHASAKTERAPAPVDDSAAAPASKKPRKSVSFKSS